MFGGVFDADSVYKKIAEQEELTSSPNFWDDAKAAQKVMSRIKILKGRVEPWNSSTVVLDKNTF